VLYCTGLRIGEALGLRRCDLDLKQACFRVGPSKGRIRWVPFHKDLARELRFWLKRDCCDARPDAYLFSNDDGHQRRVKNVSHNLRVLFPNLPNHDNPNSTRGIIFWTSRPRIKSRQNFAAAHHA
jgi:integrase